MQEKLLSTLALVHTATRNHTSSRRDANSRRLVVEDAQEVSRFRSVRSHKDGITGLGLFQRGVIRVEVTVVAKGGSKIIRRVSSKAMSSYCLTTELCRVNAHIETNAIAHCPQITFVRKRRVCIDSLNILLRQRYLLRDQHGGQDRVLSLSM